MADLSKIKLNNTTYNFKDAVARFIDIPLTLSYNNNTDEYTLTYTGSHIDDVLEPNARLVVTCPDSTTKIFYRMTNGNYNSFSTLDADDSLGLSTIHYQYPDGFSFSYVDVMGLVDHDSLLNSFQKYGVCSTAQGTAAKTVSIPSVTSLYEGLYIFVKFANTNSAENPTLEVNSLGAVAIKRYGTTAPSTAAATSWNAGNVIMLIYDGTYWQMVDWINTTYSAMTSAEATAGTSTTSRLITPARLKQGVETWAPVQSVNGLTGNLVIDKVETTGSDENTDYNLISTIATNTNTTPVEVYQQNLLSFSKTSSGPARLTIGSTSAPGEVRLYTSASSASGYTDLKSAASGTNTRTITFPDATGTVALTSDIPSISSWALASSKPSYTFSELTTTPTSLSGYGIADAYTKTEVDGLVSGVLHYKGTKATVSALPSSGNTTGDVWHITADGSEYAWDGSAWQELGTATDLSGYVPTSRKVNNKALTGDISLTASDVGALSSSTTYVSSFNGESGAITYTAPVTSVNGQTGAVTLTIPDADDKTWNNISWNVTQQSNLSDTYLPQLATTSSTEARIVAATVTPTEYKIAKYNTGGYLMSTTPSANDNSTKVATTAYVDNGITTVVGNLSNLTTTAKSNLVSAINEIVTSGGSTTIDMEWEDVYAEWQAGYYYDADNNYAYTQIPSTETIWSEATARISVSCTPYNNLIAVKPGEAYRYKNPPVHFDSKNAEIPSVIIFNSNKVRVMSYTRPYQDIYTEFTIPADGAWLAVVYYNNQEYSFQKQVAKRHDQDAILNDIMANYRSYKLTTPPTQNTLTKAYFCIGTDDLRGDQTKALHDMFTTYGIPYYMAAIPSKAKVCVSDDPYKTNLDYMRACVTAGGEIVCHSAPVITASNKNDFDTMYQYFYKNKKELEAYGFTVNGIYKAGGDNAIYDQADPVIDAWATYYYDFGDYFTNSYPYYTGRTLLDDWDNYSGLTSLVQEVIQNHTFRIMAFHYYNANAETAMETLFDALENYTEGVDYEFVTPTQLYNLLMPTSTSGGGGSIVDTNTTYTLSMSNNRITLTPSSGTATYVDLPVYNGGVL